MGVLVLPQIESPESFPNTGEIKLASNNFCDPPREEQHCAWGFCKTISYSNGGWTCVEYSVARNNGTIANSYDPQVQEVEASRTWPESVYGFAQMMDPQSENPVAFTKKGDRDVVR